METEDDEVSPVAADLYFLVHQFLSGGPLRKTLKAFHDELSELKVLPKRIDWAGEQHERTIEDMQNHFPQVRPDYLLQLCCRASNNSAPTSSNKIVSLFSLKKAPKQTEYNFKQLCDYVRRFHLVPLRDTNITCNIVNSLRGREISGPLSRRWMVSPRLYSSLHFQRRTLGHLSAVYCLLFDHSGNYIITGADDLLIKLWSSRSGRLMVSFRGASSEITDIAINLENTLLAAGSIDRILRIWDLETGAPVAVLTGHTGMITSVNFCPSPSWSFQYLITTSTDGSVAFWAYSSDTTGKVNFRTKPTTYQERMRPGQAQMICSSFSPGGTFLATGSADHHVRVYYMKGDEGPHRILETEAHTDRVDSIQWAHSGLRFLSGSKDGTAIIWSFESQQWKTLYLTMTPHTPPKPDNSKKTNDEGRKLKVTMVAWDQSDNWIVTAVSDYTLKIWNARTGHLDKVLPGHTDEVYVLESHPHDGHVILSAGHDGQLFVWDIIKGEVISKFLNTIEHQGFGAIFDVKWSPDGNVIAASDSHGQILIFGFGSGNKLLEQLPKELFFHTDYRPLMRDNNNYVLDEQTQIPPHLMPPPFLVDIDGNPYPPMLQRLVPGREHCNTEQLIPSIVIGNEGNQEVIQEVMVDDHARNEEEVEETRSNTFRAGPLAGRRSRDSQGIRQSTGDWQSDPSIKWKRHVLIPHLKQTRIKRMKDIVDEFEKMEMQEYQRQLCQRPHMINTSSVNDKNNDKGTGKKRASNSYRTRTGNVSRKTFVVVSEASESESESESSGYSDWEADHDINEDVNVESPKRTRRRQVKYENSGSEGDKNEEEEESSEEEERPEPSRAPRVPPVRVPVKNNNVQRRPVPEVYKTSEWLTEVRARKSPYFPQMGDQLVYFPQGHHLYLDAVQGKNVYEVNGKTLPWSKLPLRSHEFVKVVGIQYEIKPPRLCNLRLALLDEEGRLTGKTFTVKYHDMPDVLDFFVLKQNFDTAMSRNWKIGDKFRCMIDDGWWIGEIVAKNNASEAFPDSPFLCYEIKWDNGELEKMSPWDMELIDDSRVPENPAEALPVLEEELRNILYQPIACDWPNNDRDTVTSYVTVGLSKVMELAIAEPFLVPVDLTQYPTYAFIIEYPIDISTIKARFENRFYRRITAAQFDIRHLAINAEKFNERHSIIVKHARILTELCLRIIKQCTTNIDVTAVYHQLVDTYDSTDTEVDIEITPSSSNRMLRCLPTRYLRDASDWKAEAQKLFDAIWDCEDSVPFRAPVNTTKYIDYHQVIKTPMDLSTVKEKLSTNSYETPNDFYSDMRLIFQNSRTYNTNQRSRIYVMTVRLAAIFEEHISTIIRHWKLAKRRRNHFTGGKTDSAGSSISTSSDSGSDLDVAKLIEKKSSNESDSDAPLTRLQRKKVPNVESSENEESSGSDASAEVNQDNSDDSEDSFKPSYKTRNYRKRRQDSSEDDDSSDNSDDDDKPLSFHKQNGRSKRVKYYAGPRKKNGTSEDEEEDDDKFVTSVSSRGRVRKLNPRVTAFMKK